MRSGTKGQVTWCCCVDEETKISSNTGKLEVAKKDPRLDRLSEYLLRRKLMAGSVWWVGVGVLID